MRELYHQRCRNHQYREAVARCPECGRFFCRECITEHEDRVLCAECLSRLMHASAPLGRSYLSGLLRIFHFVLGTGILWMIFYYLGQALLLLPSSFHEGTLWQTKWWENP